MAPIDAFTDLVQLVHAEAAHFGFDVFADVFGRWQEAPFRLKAGTKQKVSNTLMTSVCVCVCVPLFQHTVEECVLTDGGLDTSGWAATEHSRCKCRSPCRSATLRPNAEDMMDSISPRVCVCGGGL